ncbi:DUF2190 family protein [Rhizobium pusense]|uniref:capsid cement protein n=1 Tax=Agrobacterium pusense TaxID=648995 RepID=UPI00244BCD25|nr:DUF2190 family protein [Agrobacterium pusense]MDH1093830.1 DUF2190 family protein [Agrobacterium pusense]MDH1110274.1 DUF2190 family protein [Agrobacterium pusense]MDH2193716.1 DUF2190 family protein [Agrobacterium pusense]
MQFFNSLYSETLTATTVFAAYDLVDFNDAKITADDAPVKAMAQAPATVGLDVAGMMIGTARLRARGAIAKGDKLISAAAGGVKTATGASVNVFARALTAAADGEFVTVFMK